MDNNNEYKRSVGISGTFPTYDDVPAGEDYSSMSSYESSSTSDFSNLGSLETTSSYDYGSTITGSYTASYNAPSYTASYNEPEPEVEPDTKNEAGNTAAYNASSYTANYNEPEPEPQSEAAGGAKGDYSSFYSGNSSQNGMDSNAYQSLYSDYDSSQANNYKTSLYSASELEEDKTAVGGYNSISSSSYNTYTASENSNSSYNSYTAPEQNDNSNIGFDSYREPETNEYRYGPLDSAPQTPTEYDGYKSAPVDKKGRPLKNRFGLKLTLSIIEIVFATLWGILGLVFTCMANNAYNRGDWDAYQSKSKIATIMLWIGLVLSILSVAAIAMLVGAGAYTFGNKLNVNNYINEQPIGGDDIIDDGIVDDGSGDEGGTTDFVMPDAQEYNSFTFDGTEISLPGDVAEIVKAFESKGYTFQYDVYATHVKPKDSEYLAFYNEDGYTIGFIDIYNNSDEEVYMVDGVVEGVDIGVEWDENIQIGYINGITNTSDAKEYIEVLGEPRWTDAESGSYEWYTEEGWISVKIKDGKLTSFGINVYSSVQ